MASNHAFYGVRAAGMLCSSATFGAAVAAHPARPAIAAAIAAPRKRRAAAGTVAASVRGFI
ncbi:hypothetical protein [Mycolicibacterium chubuense]|nr:hypothetical protein [Mycolicibacterium chubuense]